MRSEKGKWEFKEWKNASIVETQTTHSPPSPFPSLDWFSCFNRRFRRLSFTAFISDPSLLLGGEIIPSLLSSFLPLIPIPIGPLSTRTWSFTIFVMCLQLPWLNYSHAMATPLHTLMYFPPIPTLTPEGSALNHDILCRALGLFWRVPVSLPPMGKCFLSAQNYSSSFLLFDLSHRTLSILRKSFAAFVVFLSPPLSLPPPSSSQLVSIPPSLFHALPGSFSHRESSFSCLCFDLSPSVFGRFVSPRRRVFHSMNRREFLPSFPPLTRSPLFLHPKIVDNPVVSTIVPTFELNRERRFTLAEMRLFLLFTSFLYVSSTMNRHERKRTMDDSEIGM